MGLTSPPTSLDLRHSHAHGNTAAPTRPLMIFVMVLSLLLVARIVPASTPVPFELTPARLTAALDHPRETQLSLRLVHLTGNPALDREEYRFVQSPPELVHVGPMVGTEWIRRPDNSLYTRRLNTHSVQTALLHRLHSLPPMSYRSRLNPSAQGAGARVIEVQLTSREGRLIAHAWLFEHDFNLPVRGFFRSLDRYRGQFTATAPAPAVRPMQVLIATSQEPVDS